MSEAEQLLPKLRELIREQSEGEWTDAMIEKDARVFAKALAPLFAASPAPAASRGWEPIETAPKDGTRILAYNSMVGVYSTGWTTSWPGSSAPYEGFPCGHWSGLGAWDCAPSLWMPLPDAPVPAKDGEGEG
jgi:hypothetical protein